MHISPTIIKQYGTLLYKHNVLNCVQRLKKKRLTTSRPQHKRRKRIRLDTKHILYRRTHNTNMNETKQPFTRQSSTKTNMQKRIHASNVTDVTELR